MNTAQRHAACVVWWIAAAVVAGPARGDDRPDIVWIVADDLGHAELSVHGSSHVKTPHIDSIAEQGVRFTQAYAAAPVCCPSRAGLLTGRYPQRMGLGANPGPALLTPPDFGLPDDEVTAAEQLRDLGYTTALVGKWHLGYAPKKHPGHHGFDRFFGFLGGLNGYCPGRRPLDEPIFRDDRRVIEPEYLTDAFGREAVAAIDGAGDQPLFLMLSFNAVHGPLQATEEDLRRFAGVPGKRRRAYVAMTASLDDAVGDVLEALQRRNRDALIVFMSDNGGPTRETTASNEPFEGHKYQLLEGGVRVPMFAQWTGRLEPGVTFDEPVIALALLPTAVGAAGRHLRRAGERPGPAAPGRGRGGWGDRRRPRRRGSAPLPRRPPDRGTPRTPLLAIRRAVGDPQRRPQARQAVRPRQTPSVRPVLGRGRTARRGRGAFRRGRGAALCVGGLGRIAVDTTKKKYNPRPCEGPRRG